MVLLICRSGGGDHSRYLVVRQIVALVYMVIQHIHQRPFQRDGCGKLELPVVQVLTDDDAIHTLPILRNTIVLGIQHFPVDVVAIVLQLFDKEVKSGAETRSGDVLDILIDGETGLLLSQETKPLNQERRAGLLNLCVPTFGAVVALCKVGFQGVVGVAAVFTSPRSPSLLTTDTEITVIPNSE